MDEQGKGWRTESENRPPRLNSGGLSATTLHRAGDQGLFLAIAGNSGSSGLREPGNIDLIVVTLTADALQQLCTIIVIRIVPRWSLT